MKVLGVVVLDCRLTFKTHVTAVAKACNYHAQAIRHIRHLLTTELALILACSLILSCWTTAMLCCMELQTVAFSNCRMCRTLQPKSFFRRRDGLMLYHYWNSWIGFRYTSELTNS